MSEATRRKKEEWLDGLSDRKAKHLVIEMLAVHGWNWLTDDQIDDLVAEQVKRDRRMMRWQRESRKEAKQKQEAANV